MKKMKKKDDTKKKIIYIIIIVIILLTVLFGARVYLYLRVLIGNDLIIKLETDKENLFLLNGESDAIKITSHAVTNIFCTVNCTSKFIDLSTGKTLEEDRFYLKLPLTKEFLLNAAELGEGQKLYRFDLECNSPRTFLCETNGKLKKRSVLITLSYRLNQEEEILRENIRYNLGIIYGKLNYYESSLNEFDVLLKELNSSLEINELVTEKDSVKDYLKVSNQSSNELLAIWDEQDYLKLKENLILFNENFSETENEFYLLNYSIYSNIISYNSLIDNLTEIRSRLDYYKLNLSENSSAELSRLIKEFNKLADNFKEKDTLLKKSTMVFNFSDKANSFVPELSALNSPLNETLNPLNSSKFIFPKINFSLFDLKEPSSKCCLNGKCRQCCDDSCYNKPSEYPIIFIHGHSFNEKVSAETSLDTFEDIQGILNKEGYLNAGSLFLSSKTEENRGIWGKTNYPLSVKASYYFDILTNEGKHTIIQTKTDNLDTYTLRLREIINEVKYKTNRQKVTVVSHSMGGLIARRYLDVFGEEDIDRLILISVPNHGISERTLSLCPVFGTKLECNDIDKNSLFMNKLNNAPRPSMPIYNIIGIGCETNGETGDGVVTNSSQYLEYAKNYYIQGSCNSGFSYLHNEILDPEKYPEIIKMIGDSLDGF